MHAPCWPAHARNRSNLVQSGPKLDSFARAHSNVCKFGRVQAKLGQHRAKFGRCRATFDQSQPTWARVRPTLVKTQVKFGSNGQLIHRTRATHSRFRPISGRRVRQPWPVIDQASRGCSIRCWSDLCLKLKRHRLVRLGRRLARIGPIRSSSVQFSRNRSDVARVRTILADFPRSWRMSINSS